VNLYVQVSFNLRAILYLTKIAQNKITELDPSQHFLFEKF